MFLRAALLLCCGAVAITLCLGFKYQLEILDENPITSCDDWPNTPLEKYLDYSGLQFTLLENGTTHIHGRIRAVRQMPVQPVKGKLSTYKQRNNKWQPTIYNMDTNDICNKVFGPREVWHKLLQNIPKEQLLCPIPLNQFWDVDASSDIQFDSPEPSADGVYKIVIIAESAEFQEKVCLQFRFEFTRV